MWSRRIGISKRRWSKRCCCVAVGILLIERSMGNWCRRWWSCGMPVEPPRSAWRWVTCGRCLAVASRPWNANVCVCGVAARSGSNTRPIRCQPACVAKRSRHASAWRRSRCGMRSNWCNACPVCVAKTSIGSTTGTSSTGWCVSPARLPAIFTAKRCIRRWLIAGLTMPWWSSNPEERTRSTCGSCTWPAAKAKPRWKPPWCNCSSSGRC